MYTPDHLAFQLKIPSWKVRRFLRKLWRDNILLHDHYERWEFNRQEFRMLLHIYRMENG